MGLDLGDLIRNIHPLHHFAEYRIAKVALAMVEEGVIRHVDSGYTRAKEVADERGVRIPMEFKARD